MTEHEGRTFVVTGASGGLGPHVIGRLLERGDRLFLTALHADRLEQLVSELDAGDRVAALAGDMTAEEDAQRVVGAAVERFGEVNGLMALAGGFGAGMPVAITGTDRYDFMYGLNFMSAVLPTKALLPHVQGPAWFVYVSTPLAYEPMPTMGPYVASKAALIAWVRTLSREIKDRGMHANVILSSKMDTEGEQDGEPGGGPLVPAEHIAEAAAFLSSPQAGSFYGSAIPITGTFALGPAGASGPPAGPPA